MALRINSRKKGSKNERQIGKIFEEWTGLKFARTPSSGGLRWHGRSDVCGDIVCTDYPKSFPFSIEAKSHREINFEHLLYSKNPKILEFWNQCKEDSDRGDKIPLLLMRYNGLPRDFHFIVVEKELFDFCIKPFLPLSYKIMEYSEELIILTSELLFALPYKRLKRVFKNFLNNRNEIIIPFPLNSGRYLISNRGHILVAKDMYEIWGSTNGNGRPTTVIKLPSGKKKTIAIHRWVGKLFVKGKKPNRVVNHIDAVRWHNDARNLEYISYKGNSKHYYDFVDYGYVIIKKDLQGNEVGRFRSPIQAARSVGKACGSTITKVIMGKRKTAYGYVWEKKES